MILVGVHLIVSGLLVAGLLAVSGYGVAALHRFRRCRTEGLEPRTAWLIIAAWVGLVANQVHSLVMNPMFTTLPLSGRAPWLGGLGFVLTAAETGVLVLLILEFRRGALTQLIDLLGEVPRLKHEAGLDALTGLFNRRVLAMVEGKMDWPGWACLMVDVDDFKLYNDCNGHLAGDAVLARVGECIRSSVRSSDLAFRYGGEEFLILCPLSSPVEANAVAERLRNNLLATGVPVSVSIGIASGTPERSLRQSIAQADQALYQAKAAGKAQTVVWGPLPSMALLNR